MYVCSNDQVIMEAAYVCSTIDRSGGSRSVNKGEHRHAYILQVYNKEESASLHRIDFDMYICTRDLLGKTVGTPYMLHYISQHGRSQNIWTQDAYICT